MVKYRGIMEIKGKHNTAIVYNDFVESSAISQIIELCNQQVFENSTIRIMPDCHAGAGCVIGFTANLGEKVIPNLVGVDIGCGMLSINLGNIDIDFEALDNGIREHIPFGFAGNDQIDSMIKDNTKFLDSVKSVCSDLRIESNPHLKKVGSLGGGNHFIEVNRAKNKDKWLVIHTGSRNFGLQIAKYHQKIAYEVREQTGERIPKDLTYLIGDNKELYLKHMYIAQEYAQMNRMIIADRLLSILDASEKESFETVHNFISPTDNIIRKGAIMAYEGEKILIPLNMRDGSLIAIGKGNEDWNCSAPHGAGRIMSRGQAKRELSLDEFEEQMKDVFSTCVGQSTLDEAPGAYKDGEEIKKYIEPTAEIVEQIKPLYNFKA